MEWAKPVGLRVEAHHVLELTEELENSANQGVMSRACEEKLTESGDRGTEGASHSSGLAITTKVDSLIS